MLFYVWFIFIMSTITMQTPVIIPTTPKPKPLEEEYKDIIQLNKYSPALREFIAKILKAITVFDCYDLKVREKRSFFNEGSEFSAAAFDALRALKKTQTEYTSAVSASLILLRDMEKSFRASPHIVMNEQKNAPCLIGTLQYPNTDCKLCKDATPSYKTKELASIEIRILIMQMQEAIPKQFLYYATDIYIVVAEAIRIMDMIYFCEDNEETRCDQRDGVIKKFTMKMNGVVKKEKDHVQMILHEKVKMASLVEQMKTQVEATLKLMKSCLEIKKVKLRKRGGSSTATTEVDFKAMEKEIQAIAEKYKLKFDKIEAKDSDRFTITLVKEVKKSIGSKVAEQHKRRRQGHLYNS